LSAFSTNTIPFSPAPYRPVAVSSVAISVATFAVGAAVADLRASPASACISGKGVLGRAWSSLRGRNSGAPQGAPPGVTPAASPGLSHDASHDLNHGSNRADDHAGNSGGKHAAEPCRIGDSIVHPDIDGSPTLPGEAYAGGFIEHLQQHPALQGLLDEDGWISARALKRKYLPGFLASIADAPLAYRTIAAQLGKLVEKREVQKTLARGRKRRRRTVTEYLIPAR